MISAPLVPALSGLRASPHPPAPQLPSGRRTAHDTGEASLAIELSSDLTNLKLDVWDRLTKSSSFFLRRPYLLTLGRNPPQQLEPRYAVVRRSGEPLAGIVAQYLDLTGAALSRAGTRNLSKRVVGRLRVRILICGNVFSWGPHGYVFAGGYSPETQISAIVEALERIDRAEAPSRRADFIAVKDLGTDDRTLSSHFERKGFVPLPTQPDMVLALQPQWSGFDDYLGELKTRYRRSVRKIGRCVKGAGYSVEPLPPGEIARHKDRLNHLYLQVHRKARVRLAPAPASYLPALAQAAGERLRCTVIRRNHDIVAFVTTLADGDTAFGYHLGFDRGLGARLPLYLRLLHATVADALALGCRELSLGRTALDSKARLGATPRPLDIWLRGRHRFHGFLAKVPEFYGSWDAPARRPFRHPS